MHQHTSPSILEALNGTYEGMQAALRSMPQEQLAQVRLLWVFFVIPRALRVWLQDQLKLQRHPQAQAVSVCAVCAFILLFSACLGEASPKREHAA